MYAKALSELNMEVVAQPEAYVPFNIPSNTTFLFRPKGAFFFRILMGNSKRRLVERACLRTISAHLNGIFILRHNVGKTLSNM